MVLRALYISLLLLFAFVAGMHSQASYKLLEDHASPTLNLAVKYYKEGEFAKVDSLYKLYISEQKLYLNELLSNEKNQRDDVHLTDFLKYCYNMAIFYNQQKESEKIKELLKNFVAQGVTVAIKYKKDNSLLYAHLLSVAAHLSEEPERIKRLHSSALSIFEKQLGTQHIIYADELSRLAYYYLKRDELLKAESMLLKVKSTYEIHYKEDDGDYLNLMWNLMSTYFLLFNFDKARYYVNKISKIIEGIDNVDISHIRDDLTKISQSIEYFEKPLSIFSPSHRDIDLMNIKSQYGLLSNQYIDVLIINAYMDFKNGYIERSDSIYKIALSLEKELNGEYSIRYKEIQYAIHANTTKNSRIERLKNLLHEKELRYGIYSDEAMDINLALYKSYSDNIDSASYYLSIYQQRLIKQAEDKIPFFIEEEREMWWKKMSLNLIFLKFSIFHKREIEDRLLGYTYNGELFSKGTLLTSSQKLRESIFSSNDTILINAWNNLYQLKKDRTADKEYIADVEKEIVELSQRYRDKHSYFDIDWTHIKGVLNPNEAALEFLSIKADPENVLKNAYLVLMIRADWEYPKLVSAFFEADIKNAAMSEDKDDLYELLWSPIEEYLKKGDVVYIAPTGILHNISFAGLSHGNGKQYLCEDYTIHNLLSTRDIIKLKNKKESFNKQKQIALFGGVDYLLPADELKLLDQDIHAKGESNLNRSTLNEMDSLRGPGFMYLPGTKREAQRIDTYLTGLHWKTSLFTDKEATETRFKSLSSSQSPEVIHISTHGFYFPQPKQPSPDEVNSLLEESHSNVYRLSDNPLMRSGLAFAGANHVWRGNEPVEGVDDGILTAYEISNLNLFNTELVVLSACNTGLGDIDHSEGVYGLQRAFRLAGVQTMIVSLWEVPDKETVELMTVFYSMWGEGMTKKEAFDKAQMQMRYAYPNQPEKWAGFIMIE